MAAKTLTTPHFGQRVRTATQRRYVLIFEHMPASGMAYAQVVKRSDKVETLVTFRKRQSVGRDVFYSIFDTTTGERVNAHV